MLAYENNIATNENVQAFCADAMGVQEQTEALVSQSMHVTLDAYLFDTGNGTSEQHYLLTLRHLEEFEWDIAAARDADAFERHYVFEQWDDARDAFFAALQHKLQFVPSV